MRERGRLSSAVIRASIDGERRRTRSAVDAGWSCATASSVERDSTLHDLSNPDSTGKRDPLLTAAVLRFVASRLTPPGRKLI